MVFIVTPIVLTIIIGTLIYRHYRPDPYVKSFVCPEEDIIQTNGCLGPKDCLYAHPNDCYSYIQCVHDPEDDTWKPLWLPCQGGLEWNDIEKICDWRDKSTCRRGMRQKMQKFKRATSQRVRAPQNWFAHHVKQTHVPSTAGYGPKPRSPGEGNSPNEGNTTSSNAAQAHSEPHTAETLIPMPNTYVHGKDPMMVDPVLDIIDEIIHGPGRLTFDSR
ncbi:hypothetical protein P152DRAFT_133332 [Eremomyces bilateralis CBS 781.70]|uniref:Chitin-binding type-2 domain-containing protein n=1 Tax=Eremomyces bilateralis CBS 781.70 TaxID=1392243 RepID=A0A6G1GFL5_9PEZI|nr:uncharacterized protein P152DRAFT_133332 [Eremomyces bilateralis CBS 781.70]KAF1816669.1 hypothetical protein P152DRAFT_133332 [Eremomyces bilateralis CBS 781.70]